MSQGTLHAIRQAAIDDLARGRVSAETADTLRAAELSRRLITLRWIEELADGRAPAAWERSGAAQAWALFGAADAADRAALHATLRHPPVGALLGRLLRTLDGLPERPRPGSGRGAEESPGLIEDLEGLTRLAVAAALRAGVPVAEELPVRDGRLPLPTWGVALLPEDVRRVRVEGPQLRVPGRDLAVRVDGPAAVPRPTAAASGGAAWAPVPRVEVGSGAGGPRLSVLLEDGDPYREAFGFSVGGLLTADQLAGWSDSLERAWGVLRAHHPDRAAFCASLCHALVPLTPAERRSSATSRELFGAVALSWSADPLLLADSLVHEVAHLALGALTGLVDLYHPDHEERYPVGWRPEPRPIGAVLQGLYAHVQVVDFWCVQRDRLPAVEAAGAEARYARLHGQVLTALGTLEGSRALTGPGRRLWAGMAALAGTWPAPSGAARRRPAAPPPPGPTPTPRPGENGVTSGMSPRAVPERMLYSARNRYWGPSEVRTSPSWESP